MKQNNSSYQSASNFSNQIYDNSIESSSLTSKIQKWNNEISLLSYEESLIELDRLLECLQDDRVPVEDLQKFYLKGKMYLEHCENLLKDVEQEVVELKAENMKEYLE
ncbi:exodeoxyribonuclease VII small subunit [Prochlorococcus sp. MIT 1307]|uniref:exodeoxyribonuclease VII small subunit n=1 Tax=Prochlorococcus sp. MIT 1307 TaxID=3096219 RepID=UPI002A75AADA|nr:exodeoxyribonuclease VII small subunit [Prochlorococcus sp. MIT 1307]